MKIHYRGKYLTDKELESSDFEFDVSKGWIPFKIHLRSTTPEERKEQGKPKCFQVLGLWFHEVEEEK